MKQFNGIASWCVALVLLTHCSNENGDHRSVEGKNKLTDEGLELAAAAPGTATTAAAAATTISTPLKQGAQKLKDASAAANVANAKVKKQSAKAKRATKKPLPVDELYQKAIDASAANILSASAGLDQAVTDVNTASAALFPAEAALNSNQIDDAALTGVTNSAETELASANGGFLSSQNTLNGLNADITTHSTAASSSAALGKGFSDQAGGLAQDSSQLQSQASQASSSAAQKQAEVTAMPAPTTSTIDVLEAKVNELQSIVLQFETKTNDLETSVDAFEGTVDGLDQATTKLKASTDKLQTTVSSMSANSKSIDDLMGALKPKVDAIDAKFTVFQGKATGLATARDKLATALTSLAGILTNMRDASSKIQDELDTVEDSTIPDLMEQMETAKGKDKKNLQAVIDLLKQGTALLQLGLKNLNTNIRTQDELYQTKSDILARQNSIISDVGTRVLSIKAAITTQRTALSSMENIKSLQSGIISAQNTTVSTQRGLITQQLQLVLTQRAAIKTQRDAIAAQRLALQNLKNVINAQRGLIASAREKIANTSASTSASKPPAPTCSLFTTSNSSPYIGDSISVTVTGTNIASATIGSTVINSAPFTANLPITASGSQTLQASVKNSQGVSVSCVPITVQASYAPPSCSNVTFNTTDVVRGGVVQATIEGQNIAYATFGTVQATEVQAGTKYTASIQSSTSGNFAYSVKVMNKAKEQKTCGMFNITVKDQLGCSGISMLAADGVSVGNRGGFSATVGDSVPAGAVAPSGAAFDNTSITITGLGAPIYFNQGVKRTQLIALPAKAGVYTASLSGSVALKGQSATCPSSSITVNVSDPNDICTADQLIALNGTSKSIRLICDIDLAGKDWEPIADFSGSIDGNNKTIRNLTSSKGGLFNKLRANTVKNLNLQNVNISVRGSAVSAGQVAIGALAHQAYIYKLQKVNLSGKINLCFDNASLPPRYRVAGLISGQAYSIEDVTSNTDVTLTVCSGSAQNSDGYIDGIATYATYMKNVSVNSDLDCSAANYCAISGLGEAHNYQNVSYVGLVKASGTSKVGGLSAYWAPYETYRVLSTRSLLISNAHVNMTVDNSGTGLRVGGLVAYGGGGSMEINSANVLMNLKGPSNRNEIGGLFGELVQSYGWSNGGYISDSQVFNNTAVQLTNIDAEEGRTIGGFIGRLYYTYSRNSSAPSKVDHFFDVKFNQSYLAATDLSSRPGMKLPFIGTIYMESLYGLLGPSGSDYIKDIAFNSCYSNVSTAPEFITNDATQLNVTPASLSAAWPKAISDANLKKQETFVGWNFSDIWTMPAEGSEYPRLKFVDAL